MKPSGIYFTNGHPRLGEVHTVFQGRRPGSNLFVYFSTQLVPILRSSNGNPPVNAVKHATLKEEKYLIVKKKSDMKPEKFYKRIIVSLYATSSKNTP